MAVKKYMTDADWSKFKNFKKSEFKCKCKGKYCNGYPSEIAYSLVELLQKTRDYYKKPITITSGLRCKTHNKNVGGTTNSKHMTGQAVDFYFSGMNKNEVIKWLKKQANYNYAYTNSSNMKYAVHADTKLTTISIITNVARDKNKNQLKVLATNLNVRIEPNTKSESLGNAKQNGIYNYYEIKTDAKYTWYRIADNQWIANNGKYLEIYSSEEDMKIEELNKEIERLEAENKDLMSKNEKLSQNKADLEQKLADSINIPKKYKSVYKCLKSGSYTIKIDMIKDEQLYIA